MVWFRNNKVIKFALVTWEVPSEHHTSAWLASQAVDKSCTFDHLFRQKENAFHLTFQVSWPIPQAVNLKIKQTNMGKYINKNHFLCTKCFDNV